MNITEFRQHILIRLGSPVINIEIAPTQMDISINDTIEKFIEVHYDGLDEGYIFLDTVIDQDEYTIPDNIHSVLEILSLTSSISTDEPLLINPYLVGNNYGYTSLGGYFPSVLDIVIYQQNIAQYQSIIKERTLFDFNYVTHILKIHQVPTSIKKIALKVHSIPEEITTIYDNTWVQKYSAALCKKTWGENLGKYEGATLPGGVSLNYQRIIEEAREEIEKLEEELYSKYAEPIDFYFR